jgi:hypothetical protein
MADVTAHRQRRLPDNGAGSAWLGGICKGGVPLVAHGRLLGLHLPILGRPRRGVADPIIARCPRASGRAFAWYGKISSGGVRNRRRGLPASQSREWKGVGLATLRTSH